MPILAGKRRALVAACSVILVAGATMASGEENKAEVESPSAAAAAKAGDSSAAPSAANAEGSDGQQSGEKVAKIGETVKLGDWKLMVSKFTDPVKPSNEYMKPKAGSRWVAVTATVTNNSDKAETVSSMMCFDLRDSEDQKYSVTITGENNSQLDGEVGPGQKLKGVAEFEVPDTAKGFKLNFKCDLFSSGSAVVKLS